MKKERKDTSPIVRAIGLLVSVMLMSAIALPVAAAELTDNHHIYIGVENPPPRANDYNNNTYYYKFDGGGLNALHISDNYTTTGGQVTNSDDLSGSFYITDTGGRGYMDDIVLMLAVNGTIPDDFEVNISSEGYAWTITTGMPTEPNVGFVIRTNELPFGQGNFLQDIAQIWRPYTTDNYSIYYGQDMSDTENTFQLMFVDLKAGVLGTNCPYRNNLTYNGALKVNYEFTNLTSFAVFDAYGYTFQSNQSKGISWTNRVNDTGSSGWTVTPSE